MGDIADYLVDQMIERAAFGGRRRGNPRDVWCDRCGKKPVRWKETPEGWRLFEVGQRGPGNRSVQHVCNFASDFD